MLRILYSLITLGVLFFCCISSAQQVVYGGKESDPYHLNLLKHALSYHKEKNYQVNQYEYLLPKQRAFVFLRENDGVHVLSGSATQSRLTDYRAIYFPLYKGLKGWRLAIINQNTPELLKPVTNKQMLQALHPVQFHSWISAEIFEHNDITVVKGSSFKGLFEMLEKNRADYLPRSILEVEQDLSRYPELTLMVDPYLLIKYPSVVYFYVNKNNTELAKHISDGLEKSLKDGSFDRIFNESFGAVIEKYNLKKRQVISLDNPFHIDSKELHRSELWAEHWLHLTTDNHGT